jgi:hypothetical protein
MNPICILEKATQTNIKQLMEVKQTKPKRDNKKVKPKNK